MDKISLHGASDAVEDTGVTACACGSAEKFK